MSFVDYKVFIACSLFMLESIYWTLLTASSHLNDSMQKFCILGPLDFIISINDIAYSSNSLSFSIYEDDTNMFLEFV